ncbi:MAG: glycosyltransferase family 4 protein [Thermodesulfobacteriota bacterium]
MKPKLKLCFIGWGSSIHMQRWMQWFMKSGHEVYLITNHPSKMDGITEYDISDGEEYSGSGLRKHSSLWFNVYLLKPLFRKIKVDVLRRIINVRKFIREIQPDVVHLHTLLYPSYLGVFSGFHPLVVTPWNGDIVWKSQWSRIRKYAIRQGLAKADFITVDSDELRLKILRYGKYENKIEFISFGVDTKLFCPGARSPELRKQLKIEPDVPVILSNRSFEDLYNIDVIIKSIHLVLGVLPKATLFAWHSASRKDYLMKLAESMGVMNNVRFVGKVRHDELPEYYTESDIFVTIPSGDTISISLLEAMACGVVPVVSDLPSSNECISDGVNGHVVPVRDVEATAQAILKLLGNRELRKSIVQRNREWMINNADWDTNMKKVEELYYSLIL